MKIRQIKLLNFGSLTTDTEEEEINDSSLTGYFLRPKKIQCLDRIDTLKGLPGLKFGIEYFIEGPDNAAKYDDVTFYCKILHPEIVNPDSKEKASETIERKTNYLNETNFDYYLFEFDWEIKQGIWTFQIIENDKILLEKSFEIN